MLTTLAVVLPLLDALAAVATPHGLLAARPGYDTLARVAKYVCLFEYTRHTDDSPVPKP
jgi:hypothetical protein